MNLPKKHTIFQKDYGSLFLVPSLYCILLFLTNSMKMKCLIKVPKEDTWQISEGQIQRLWNLDNKTSWCFFYAMTINTQKILKTALVMDMKLVIERKMNFNIHLFPNKNPLLRSYIKPLLKFLPLEREN